MAQQRNAGWGRHILEVSASHRIRHTHINSLDLLWTSDQLVAEAATYTTQNKHKRRKPIPFPQF